MQILIVAMILVVAFPTFAATQEEMKLVGHVVGGRSMTMREVQAMEPACRAIGMGTIDGVFWAEGMNRNGTRSILDRPEYAMAKDAVWFHHYCWGKLAKHRVFASASTSDRNFLVTRWRSEMEYIINWTAREKINWPYLPLIHTEIAESYLTEKRLGDALKSAMQAVTLDPVYSRGYIMLTDIYEKMNQQDKALESATEGLKHMPESRALQRRYTELGGKKPFPEPYAKPEQPAEETPSTAKQEERSEPVETPPAEVGDRSFKSEESRPKGASDFCRFCP